MPFTFVSFGTRENQYNFYEKNNKMSKHKDALLFLVQIFLLLFFSLELHAQAQIKGRVIETSNGKNNNSYEVVKGIPGVLVNVTELSRSTITDSNGYFILSNLPKGIFSIQFSKAGYFTRLEKLDSKVEIENQVSLKHSSIELKEVVISGVANTLQSKTPYSIETLTKADIQQTAALTLTEALTRIPGVNQMSTGTGIAKPVIRGLYGNRILTLIDGVRFDNQQWQDEHGLGLTDVGVNRVEIIKGPASLLYGSEAMGGVLNVIKEKPAAIGSVNEEFSSRFYSNTLGVSAQYGIKASTENTSKYLCTGVESHADYQDGNNNRVLNTRFSGGTVKTGLSWFRPKKNTSLDFIGSLYSFGFVTTDNVDRLVPDNRFSRSSSLPHHTVGFGVLSLQNTYYFDNNSRLKFNVGLHSNNRQEQEYGNKISLNMLLNSLQYDLKWIKQTNKNTEFVIGTQGMGQHNSNFGSRVIIPDAFNLEIAGFGFIKKEIQNLNLEAGARYDLRNIHTLNTQNFNYSGNIAPFSSTYHAFNGSLGGSYSVFRLLRIKANASTGYRSPNLAELSSNGLHEGTFRWEVGDPGLKREQSLALESGLDFSTKTVSATATVFNNYIKDYVFLSPTGTEKYGFQVYNYIQENARLQGGELSIDLQPDFIKWLDLHGSYSTVIGKRIKGGNLPFIPANKINAEIKLETEKVRFLKLHNAFIKFGMDYVFSQKDPSEFETQTPAYVIYNASVGTKFLLRKKEISISFIGNNITNTIYFDHLSRFKPLGIYNIGRNLVLNLRIPFR